MDTEQEIYLINVTGRDRPGLVAKITGALADYDVHILDIAESVIHNYISFSILIEIPNEYKAPAILKDLLWVGHDLDLTVRFNPVPLSQYEHWVTQQGRQRRIITLMGRKLTARQISIVSNTIAEHNLNIDTITRLSGRTSLKDPAVHPKACVQMMVKGFLVDPQRLRQQLLTISQEMAIDISIQVDDIYQRNRRVVVFDMDSTLIQVEVINELAKKAGVGDEVSAITASAMRGELDFTQSLQRRVALLKGLDEGVLQEIAVNLPLTEGAELVTKTLKRLGYKLGILSGGFDYFGHHLQRKLGFDYVYANQLEIIGGQLTGRVLGEVVDGPKKAELLRKIAQEEEVSLEQTIAVGDGANDLPMLSIAGMGVAFHAKPIVREQTERAISTVGLDGLLYLMGIGEKELTTG
ncbi:MAG: phosphoserine phosphatase SerB [Chloroflexota bacterium]